MALCDVDNGCLRVRVLFKGKKIKVVNFPRCEGVGSYRRWISQPTVIVVEIGKLICYNLSTNSNSWLYFDFEILQCDGFLFIGTFLGGFMSCCCGRPRIDFRPAKYRCPVALMVMILGVMQLVSSAFFLVGWLWSIIWGFLMVNLSGKSQHKSTIFPIHIRHVYVLHT